MQVSRAETEIASTSVVQNSIVIAAPLDTVWRYTIDVNHWPVWCPTIQSSRQLSDGDLCVGSRFALKQPMQAEKVWRVTDLVDGRFTAWETDQPKPQFKAAHYMKETAGLTESTLEIEFRPGSKLISFVLARVLALALAKENMALKTVSEAG